MCEQLLNNVSKIIKPPVLSLLPLGTWHTPSRSLSANPRTLLPPSCVDDARHRSGAILVWLCGEYRMLLLLVYIHIVTIKLARF